MLTNSVATQTHLSFLRTFNKILVIDEDASTAATIARCVDRSTSEVIACRDMALAEAVLDLTEFDVILVAPSATGLEGADGLDGVDFLWARNPSAVTAVMLSRADGDLKAVATRRGSHAVLDKPLSEDGFAAFSRSVGIPLACAGGR